MRQPTKTLLKRATKGDHKAQQELYDFLKGKIMGVCHRYCQSSEDAKDIFQDTMIKVFKSLNKVEELEKIHSWAKRIAINTAIDAYKQKRTEMFVSIDDTEESQFTQSETSALEKMSADEIADLIGQLSPSQIVVFNLYMIDGYSHKEIADQLGIVESSSRVILVRARKKLIELIQKKTYYEQVSG